MKTTTNKSNPLKKWYTINIISGTTNKKKRISSRLLFSDLCEEYRQKGSCYHK